MRCRLFDSQNIFGFDQLVNKVLTSLLLNSLRGTILHVNQTFCYHGDKSTSSDCLIWTFISGKDCYLPTSDTAWWKVAEKHTLTENGSGMTGKMLAQTLDEVFILMDVYKSDQSTNWKWLWRDVNTSLEQCQYVSCTVVGGQRNYLQTSAFYMLFTCNTWF